MAAPLPAQPSSKNAGQHEQRYETATDFARRRVAASEVGGQSDATLGFDARRDHPRQIVSSGASQEHTGFGSKETCDHCVDGARGSVAEQNGAQTAAADRLPDPAIALGVRVQAAYIVRMSGDFEELRERVTAAGRLDGRNATPLAGVAVIRSDAPIRRKQGWSPSLSLGVIIQGRKRVHFGPCDYVYHPGQYLVVTGERAFEASVEQASATRPYLSLSVLVDPALVARLLMAISDSARTQAPTRAAHTAPVALDAYVSRLDEAMTDALVRLLRSLDDPAECSIVGPLVIEEIVFRLLRSESASVLRELASRGDDQRRIHAAMAFIREHAKKRLTVEQIARHVAMSPSHFAHRFRDIARVTPMQYVKHVRLDRARLLMLHHGARAAEAAAAVGYANAAHFTRDFKRHFDGPPLQYIERLRASME